MNTKKLISLAGAVSIFMIISVGFPLAFGNAQTGHENHSQMNMMNMGQSTGEQVKEEVISLEKIHTESLPMVLKSIEKAVQAVQAGNNNAALLELANTKTMITAIDKAVSQHITPKFVNNKCPIMGTTIDPANVTEDLIREYKGQKVAFCCNMCPAQWDKLSDAEKEAKLAKVKISPQDKAENKI